MKIYPTSIQLKYPSEYKKGDRIEHKTSKNIHLINDTIQIGTRWWIRINDNDSFMSIKLYRTKKRYWK